MQISSLGSKLEKFVHLFVLLFSFLGYYYKFFFKKLRLLSFDTLFCGDFFIVDE